MHSQPTTPSPPSSPVSSSSSHLPISSDASTVTVGRSIGPVLPQSGFSAVSSVQTRLSTAPTTTNAYARLEPLLHPHARFIHRTEENCPTHLAGKQRTNWLKAGKKAQNNQQILLDAPPFSWPEHSMGEPVFIHRLTPEHTFSTLIARLAPVRIFAVDTESTISRQGLTPVPSLIQIQAIHDLSRSTIVLIEVQHLPSPQSSSFRLCQQLSQLIFASNNHFLAWGDLTSELSAFDSFQLFNSSTIHHCINLQTRFTSNWNLSHPHLPTCPISSSYRSAQTSTDELICFVDANDLDSDVPLHTAVADSHLCTCPMIIRPYKTTNPQWSLQNAIYHTFHEALDKSFTLSVWSCGLDPVFYSSSSSLLQGRITRNAMILYAINDVLGPTRLYFHLFFEEFLHLAPTMPPPIVAASIITSASSVSSSSQIITHHVTQSSSALPVTPSPSHTSFSSQPDIYLLADSHGRCLPPLLNLTKYNIQVAAISGLRFVDVHAPHLCASTLIQSSSLSEILSNVKAIILFIGTNAIRSHSYDVVIDQVANLVSTIRRLYPHLSSPQSITILSTFPCYKPSNSFPTTSSLLNNISLFNEDLHLVSQAMGFSMLNLPVTSAHLAIDRIHIHPCHHAYLADCLSQYINTLSFPISPQPTSTSTDDTINVAIEASPSSVPVAVPDSSPSADSDAEATEIPTAPTNQPNRTADSKQRRNQRRHAKRHERRLQHIISRTISPLWTLSQVKQYIRHLNVRFAFLAPIRHNTLRIAFNHEVEMTIGDHALPEALFDNAHYHEWLAQKTQP